LTMVTRKKYLTKDHFLQINANKKCQVENKKNSLTRDFCVD